MTERLYYRDSYRREFDARVVSQEAAPQGGVFVVLDQTAFYPTSGGQPSDRGWLDGIAVEEVLEREDGTILHLLARAPEGVEVRGQVDWSRRFDHMQQHTGQHILSAACLRLFKLSTVSFHLGRDTSTIDLATRALGQRQIRHAEDLANQVIFEDRPVKIDFVAPESVEEPVRRKVDRPGQLRVISIEDFDSCPCGGTHVARTGEVGLLLVRSVEKQKQNLRIEFVCGGRALAAARVDHEHLSEAARLLTTGTAQLPDILRKQFEERREIERARARLLERLADYQSAELLRSAEAKGEQRLVCQDLPEADLAFLRLLAARLMQEPGVQVLLAGRANPLSAGAAAIVLAQSPGLSRDMNQVVREALALFGGKGGGSRDFAQGSLPEAARVGEVLGEARRRLGW